MASGGQGSQHLDQREARQQRVVAHGAHAAQHRVPTPDLDIGGGASCPQPHQQQAGDDEGGSVDRERDLHPVDGDEDPGGGGECDLGEDRGAPQGAVGGDHVVFVDHLGQQ